MTTLHKSQLTVYGLRRIAQAHNGERMLFTSIGLGDLALEGNLNEVTQLTGEKQRFPISGSQVSGNNFWASCKPIGIDDPEGIYVRSIGLYIADPAHESDRDYDMLYSISSIIPNFGGGADFIVYIPHDPTNAEINFDIRLNTIISPTALVEIVGGIGSLGVATDSNLGLVRSSDEPLEVNVHSGTGKMKVNGLQEHIINERHENRIIGDYRFFSYQPSPLQLAKWRCLPLQYQIIEKALYPDLCATKWVGAGLNATADYWYKCDENGTRNPNGLYMRVEDGRGMFYRGAGANAIKKGANNAPYDGNAIGSFIEDAIRQIFGTAGLFHSDPSWGLLRNTSGCFTVRGYQLTPNSPIPGPSNVLLDPSMEAWPYLHFDASLAVPTANENRPAAISSYNCITY